MAFVLDKERLKSDREKRSDRFKMSVSRLEVQNGSESLKTSERFQATWKIKTVPSRLEVGIGFKPLGRSNRFRAA